MKKILKCFYNEMTISRRSFLKASAGIALLINTPLAGCYAPNDEEQPVGRAKMIGPKSIKAGESGTWSIAYTVGPGGLEATNGIALAVEHGTDWGGGIDSAGLYTNRFGGISISTEADAVLEHKILSISAASNVVEIRVSEGTIKDGEQILVTIGDAETGDKMHAPTIAHDATIKVFENTSSRQTDDGFPLYTEVLPSPTVIVMAHEPARLGVLAKSGARSGEEISAIIRVEDKFGNIVENFNGSISLFEPDSSTLLEQLVFSSRDKGVKKTVSAKFDSEGIYRLKAVMEGGSIEGFGGPIEINDSPDFSPVRWGMIHGHSIISDGLGTMDNYYLYARDKSNLDFVSLSDHGCFTELDLIDHQFFRTKIKAEIWNTYAAKCRDYNSPGSFLTFLSYEWTSNTFSDKIVYFLDDTYPAHEYPENPRQLYERYRPESDRITIVSHMMWATPFMRATDWDTFDNDLERIVEIASVHGIREYAGNPFWNDIDQWSIDNKEDMEGHMVIDGLHKGHRLGLTCGGDCHQGLPGNGHPGRHSCRCEGLMATRTKNLVRDEIWSNWQNRFVYGSTSHRILIDFSCNDIRMGNEIEMAAGENRRLSAVVYAPVPITRIEFIKNDPKSSFETIEFNPPVWNPGVVSTTDSDNLFQETFYYLRITMQDGSYAWSSPIWVIPV